MSQINGYSGSSQSQIIIAYANMDSLDSIKHPCPHLVTRLSAIHCQLNSLKGIQRFTQIAYLNLKFNNLQNPEEVARIPNKSALKQLNLDGNTIEYYSACTFLSLKRNGFTNLVMLNNKDYSKWGKGKQRVPNMQKINSKLDQLEKSMSKTLKRTIRNNVIEKYKICDQLEPEDENEQEPTSRETSKQNLASSQQRTPFRQISLSNVNMRKSVKEDSYPQEKSKLPQLFIEPIEFMQDDQIIHMPLTQPTATFASQKQKQCMPFKGKNYYQTEINVVSEMDDNFNSEDDEIYEISYYTNNGTRQPFLKSRQIGGAMNKSALQEMYDSVNDKLMSCAEQFYLKKLVLKTLKGIKIYKPFNLPRKVPYC